MLCPFFFTFAVMTYIHEGDKLSGLSIYIKYFAYFANNLFCTLLSDSSFLAFIILKFND
ncbi:hypothetical protein CNR480_01623 [Klebsiella pneumoniae]|nr:hypothetical protein CNR480_01623 [Klebsiella pneumoniae]